VNSFLWNFTTVVEWSVGEDIDRYIESPCVRNCCLDDRDICLGCFRSLQEIRDWSLATDEYRQSILLLADKRKKDKKDQFERYTGKPRQPPF